MGGAGEGWLSESFCVPDSDSLWEKGALHAKIEIEILAPEVSHSKNSFFLLFLFFAELVLVTLTLSLRQISNYNSRCDLLFQQTNTKSLSYLINSNFCSIKHQPF